MRIRIFVQVPNLTVYVPKDLADELRRADINVSRVCQAALRRKVRLAGRGYNVVKDEDGKTVGYTHAPTAPGSLVS